MLAGFLMYDSGRNWDGGEVIFTFCLSSGTHLTKMNVDNVQVTKDNALKTH